MSIQAAKCLPDTLSTFKLASPLQAEEKEGLGHLISLAPQVLLQLWPSLAAAMKLPEAAEMRLVAARCCTATASTDARVAEMVTRMCLPSIPSFLDLKQGHHLSCCLGPHLEGCFN